MFKSYPIDVVLKISRVNVSPYVSGIKGGACFARYATKVEADNAFFHAVREGQVRIIQSPSSAR